jgi:23S rRNA (guanosine2251-2'-O)-methyltransferase
MGNAGKNFAFGRPWLWVTPLFGVNLKKTKTRGIIAASTWSVANCQGAVRVTQQRLMRKFDPKRRFRHASRGQAAPPGQRWGPPPRDRTGLVVLYGWHSVKAAIENPARRLHRLLVTENAARRLTDDGVKLPEVAEVVRPEVIASLAGPEAVHQGLFAEADPLPSLALDELPPEGIMLVLDQITDPHNVGAILRSAAAFGVTAVITTSRHSPEATGVLAKAASGALEYVPLVTVPNLARALATLKDMNLFVVGLDSVGETDLAAGDLSAPLAIVLGAEGKGLRQLTRARCDLVARLDLPGKLKSLNVSNAAAVALHIATERTMAR